MRLIMMGTGPFAVPTFRSLLDCSHTVLALVTRPAVVVPTRGKVKVPPNPMRELGEARGIPILTPPDVNAPDSRQTLRELSADLLVVCDYGQILSPETLAVSPLGGINLHGSLLPKYRGAAPIQWAIWKGEQETGVSVIHMTPKLDAGPCLVQSKTAIGETETAEQLEPRLALLGVPAVHEALAMLAAWDRTSPLGSIQDPSKASRARRLKKSDGDVDWSKPAQEIFCQFRAVQPWPGLFTHYFRPAGDPLRVLLEQIAVVPSAGNQSPGMVISLAEGILKIATGEGAIAISKLQPAGKRTLTAADFIRGYSASAGIRFGPLPRP